MKKILGRQDEIKVLQDVSSSEKPEFLAVYGRRRIGKTYLIRNFFIEKKGVVFFDVTGSQNASMNEQIANFTDRLGEVFYNGAKLSRAKNWKDMFMMLSNVIAQTPKDKKIILFFDEFPWMATQKSGLLQTLDYFWNQYWSKDSRVKLIICGSSASWIINNIINNKGGLHNRLTNTILLEPFSLHSTKHFLEQNGFKLNNKQIVELYMVTGGVPYYLAKFDPKLSTAQNIERIAFKRNAFLLNEFDNLFSSLFDDAQVYISIVRTIAQNKSGTSQEEVFAQVNEISKGGEALKKLKALEDAGFIKSFIPHFHKKRGIYYKVIDEFTVFYLKWIEPIKRTLLSSGANSHYWESKMQTQAWLVWSGYAFELICYKHLTQISNGLGVNPTSIPNTWRYVPSKHNKAKGAQIDLLFDRNDDAITICEIKYNEKPFIIDKAYADILQNKVAVFKEQTRTTKQIFVAMITANGLKENLYAKELIHSVVTLNDLFKK
jgi:AAA+ ATPase superfamily predicted ATPase